MKKFSFLCLLMLISFTAIAQDHAVNTAESFLTFYNSGPYEDAVLLEAPHFKEGMPLSDPKQFERLTNQSGTFLKIISAYIGSQNVFYEVSRQQATIPNLTREDYETKSKNQKAGGFLLLGIGAVVLVVTAISAASSVCITCPTKPPSYTVPLILGAATMASSIPLFIASGRNKRKALNASAFLKFEQTQFVQRT